jgi:hypothetical protein
MVRSVLLKDLDILTNLKVDKMSCKIYLMIVISLMGCDYKTPVPKDPRVFRPNYNLTATDLKSIGYEELYDGALMSVKALNDTTTVKFDIDKNQNLLKVETWEIMFNGQARMDILNDFLLNNSAFIITEICDDNLQKFGEINFFVLTQPSMRLFKCNYGRNDDNSSILTIIHYYPYYFLDENNPKFKEIYPNWEEILEAQHSNEIFSENPTRP